MTDPIRWRWTGTDCTLGWEAKLAVVKRAKRYVVAGNAPIQAFLSSLSWLVESRPAF